jgi:hypothetical protein
MAKRTKSKIVIDEAIERRISQQQMVRVWDKPYEITVYQKSKSVWMAVGDYMGESVETKGSSASAATKHWCEAARYRGNIGSPPP